MARAAGAAGRNARGRAGMGAHVRHSMEMFTVHPTAERSASANFTRGPTDRTNRGPLPVTGFAVWAALLRQERYRRPLSVIHVPGFSGR